MGFGQYLKDTRGELRHVAWPTRLQTVIYTVLVVLISVFIALYLGLFDFIFTSGLRNVLSALPQQSAPQLDVKSVPISTSSLVIGNAKPAAPAPTPAAAPAQGQAGLIPWTAPKPASTQGGATKK